MPNETSLLETRLQLALDAGRLGTWTFNLKTGAQVWDKRQFELLGLVQGEVQPSRELFLSLVVPEDRTVMALRPDDLSDGARQQGQFRIRLPDGSIRWLAGHSITRVDASGMPVELVGVNWDITAEKLAEAKLQENFDELRLALDAGRMGVWRFDLITGAQRWDGRQYELLGVDPETSPSRDAFMSAVLPEDIERVRYSDADLRPGHFHDTEFRVRHPDGQIRWLTARSFARHDADGRPVERIGVNWDSTEQKQGQHELQEAERRLALATEAAELGIWDWNVETGAFFYSARARELYGFSPTEQIDYATLQQRTHPEDYKYVEPIVARALDPKLRSHETYRYRISRADTGEERWLAAHGSAVFSGDGPDARPLRYTGTLQDITTAVRLELALRDEQARLQLALAAGELAIWELELGTNKVTTSKELNRLYRFPPDSSPTYEDFIAHYAPGELERVEAEAEASVLRGDPSIRLEVKHIWPDGVVKWIGFRALVGLDEQGKPARVIGVAMDVTERRTWEETLVTTARELQHRVKNSLAIVQSIAAQSFRTTRTKEEGLRTFSGRLKALAAATDLLTKDNWTIVSVRDLIEEIVSPYREDGDDRFHLAGEDLHIDSAHSVNLGMALHELCTNAVKYGALSRDSGEVFIRWSPTPDGISLEWRERGGPLVAPPTKTGFGTRLLRSGLFKEASGSVDLAFEPEGLLARIDVRRRAAAATAPQP